MRFLQTEDFRQTYFDASDAADYPTGRLEVDQKIFTVLSGDGDAKMPQVPFIALIATDTTYPGLLNSEHVLAWKQDETNPDKFHVVRDWNYYTVFEDQIEGAIDNAPGGHSEGDATITTTGLGGVAEWNYIRIGIDPQMYRVIEVDGNDLTLEPALLRDVDNSEIVRVVADHFRAGTQDVVSRARVHSDHEQILILQVKVHLEEIQDAIGQLQHLAYPVDLVAETLTLSNHLTVGDVKSGYPDAAGMMKFAGGRFQGYDGAEWKNLDESGGGGGATLPAGSDGEIMIYDSGWTSSNAMTIEDDGIHFNTNANVLIDDMGLRIEGDLDAGMGRFNGVQINSSDLENLSGSQGLMFGYSSLDPTAPPAGIILSTDHFSVSAGLLNGLYIATGSSVPTSEAHLDSARWQHRGNMIFTAEDTPEYPGKAKIVLSAEEGIFFGSISEEILEVDGVNEQTVFHKGATFSGAFELLFDNDSRLRFVGHSSYPDGVANGTMIFHNTEGFRVRQADGWHPIVGDDLTFTAPGQPWSTLVYDPTADGGDGDWVYTNELTIEPIGVRIQKALIVGERDAEMPEEVGLIEYVNGDFQGIVAGPDGQGTLRVSLTNISPEQRLPAADLATGAFMYATQDGEGRWVWKSTGALNWDVGEQRIVSPEIKVGAGGGTSGVIRWNAGQSKLEWSDGSTWYSWEQDAVIPDPTTLGAFMYVGGTEGDKNWEETTAIAIIDNKLVTATLEVQTIRLGPDGGGEYHEFNADSLSFNSMSVHQMTGFIKDQVEPSLDFSEGWGTFKTLTADVINVNTLNLVAEEENPLQFEMERLVIVDSEPNSVRYVWDSQEFVNGREELRLIHDDLDPYIGFYQQVTSTYTGETVGEHAIGATEISVTNLGAVIEAGTRISIGNYTYRILSTSGTPTTTIVLAAPGLMELIATGTEVEVKYGGLVVHNYASAEIDYNLLVKGIATFDYTIKLNNMNDLDGELNGVPDAPGMIRYNGDFQGRLANGQWASFTRTLMDGDTDGDWGSILWWRGDQWAKNLGIDVNEDGVMRLQPDNATSAVPGAIRFTGTDFQGCVNIGVWQTLTALEELPSLPSGVGNDNATLRWSNDNWVVNPNLWSDGIKSGVTLLEIGAYENFYDAGYIVKAGGYSIGTTVIYFEGFSGPLSVGTEIKFDGHEETYEIDVVIDGNRVQLDHALVEAVDDREWFRVQGVMPRPVARGGQIRYNQNDFEGFIEGIGWASFTGHRSWLPNRIGDTLLNRGNLLFFSGQEWVADHSSYMGPDVLTLDKDLEVTGDLGVAGSASFNGIHVGSPLTYSHARLDGNGYLVGSDTVGIIHASRALSIGNQFYFSNDQTQLYTITDITKVNGHPVEIQFSPDLAKELIGSETLTTYLPQDTWINGEEVINDPTPHPGFIYFSPGRGRFRGCLSSTDTPEAPAWVDLVSPIQMVNPPVMGQTLFYNKEADYWHNTSFLLINGGSLEEEDDAYYAGWIRSELPFHIMDWQFRTELILHEDNEEDEYNQFTLGFEPDPGAEPSDPPLITHTPSELGNVASAFFINSDNFLASKIILGSGKSAPLLATDVVDFPAGYELTVFGQSYFDGDTRFNTGNLIVAKGRLNVQEGNVFVDKGDLVLGTGSLETQHVYAGGVGYFGEYVRVGYAETNGFLPVGAIRYSHPNKAQRGDWEGWDGLQWVSFTAGFHGQAIWIPEGVSLANTVPFYDEDYEGGKFRVDEGLTYDLDTTTLKAPKVEADNLDLTSPVSFDLKEGRLVWDSANSMLKFSTDGLAWVDLLRPGSSGLPSGSLEGQTLYWDNTAGQYAVSSGLRVLSNRILANTVLVLEDYSEMTPPDAAGGQVRYNQNDYEGYITGIGWVSFTGDRPMQKPEDHKGKFVYSNGEHWVGHDLFKATEESPGEWLHFSIGNSDTIGTMSGLWNFNGVKVSDGLRIQGEHDDAFHDLEPGMLQLKADQLEVYGPRYAGGTNTWGKITLGENAATDDKAVVFWSDDKFISTDLMGYDLAISGASVPHVVWATNFDIRNGFLNFGDSQLDDGYWEMSSTYGADQFDLRLVGEEDVTDTYTQYEQSIAPETLPDVHESNTIVNYQGTVFLFEHGDGNVWSSGDAGATWSALGVRDNFSGGPQSGFTIITYDKLSASNPRDGVSAKMYMLGGTLSGGSETNKVYESTDGITWVEVGTMPSTCSIVVPIVRTGGAGVIVVNARIGGSGGDSVCWRTTDMITWTSHSTDLVDGAHKSAFEWNGILYADGGWGGTPHSYNGSIYKSEDDGETWIEVATTGWPQIDGAYLSEPIITIIGDRLWLLSGRAGTSGPVINKTWYTYLPDSGPITELDFHEGLALNMVGTDSNFNTLWSDDVNTFYLNSFVTGENNNLRKITATETEYTVSTGQVFMASKPLNKILLNRPGGTIDMYGDLTLYDHNAVFKQDLTVERYLFVETAVGIGVPGKADIGMTSSLAFFNVPVTVSDNMTVTGKITAGAIATNGVENFAQNITPQGFLGVGQGLDLSDAWHGAIRYTGSVPVKLRDAVSAGATTIIVKEVPDVVPTTVSSEARILIANNTSRFQVTSVSDLGDDEWEVTVSPALDADASVDDQVNLLMNGDWEGWDGSRWVSFTRDIGAGGGGASLPSGTASGEFLVYDLPGDTWDVGNGMLLASGELDLVDTRLHIQQDNSSQPYGLWVQRQWGGAASSGMYGMVISDIEGTIADGGVGRNVYGLGIFDVTNQNLAGAQHKNAHGLYISDVTAAPGGIAYSIFLTSTSGQFFHSRSAGRFDIAGGYDSNDTGVTVIGSSGVFWASGGNVRLRSLNTFDFWAENSMTFNGPAGVEFDTDIELMGPNGTNKLWSHHFNPYNDLVPGNPGPSVGTHVIGNFDGGYRGASFDASTRQFGFLNVQLPEDYAGQALQLVLTWTSASITGAGSHVCRWRARLGTFGDGDSMASLVDVGNMDDTFQGQYKIHKVTSAKVTPANAVAGGLLCIGIDRQADSVVDTLTSQAVLIGVTVKY